MRLLFTVLVTFFLLSISPAQSKAITAQAQPVWSGSAIGFGVPIYIDLENSGASVRGSIEASELGEQNVVEFPVDLPSGSKKRILYIPGNLYDNKLRFVHSLGTNTISVSGGQTQSQLKIGLISDNPSDLIFIEGDASNREKSIGAGGCRPEDAPDRLVGYHHLNALVMGEGSQRLREPQIKAIRSYVRAGGVLLFVGGATSSAATDPRWKSDLPITNASLRNTNVNGSTATEMVGTLRPDAASVASLSLGRGTVRSFGVGLIVHYSLDPFESPVKELSERRPDVLKCLYRNYRPQVTAVLANAAGFNVEDDSYGGSTSVRSMTPLPGSDMTYDPFNIQAPSVSQLAWILLGYIVFVLPVNFMILRKLKRLELAWVTTPVISLIFSFILLSSTVGLYRANEVSMTGAAIAIGGSDRGGTMYAKTQMFFPAAKAYDLGLKGIDFVQTSNYGYGMNNNQAARLQLMDSGKEIIGPAVETTNLAFREFNYVGTQDGLAGLSATYTKVGRKVTLTLANNTKFKITFGRVWTNKESMNPKEFAAIAPGASARFSFELSPVPAKETSSYMTIARISPTGMVVSGVVEEMRVGPGHGRRHPSSYTHFACTPTWGGQL